MNKSKMPSGLICSKEEKDELAEFIVCSFLRHPYQLKNTVDYYADLITDDSHIEFIHLVGDLFNMWNWGSPKSLLEHSVKTMSFNPNLEGSPTNVLKTNLLQMNMFFICSTEKRFMTSSFPVLGTNQDYQQIFFPISPDIILCYSDSSDTRNKRNRFNMATAESIDILNTMYLFQPENICRYLIAHEENNISSALDLMPPN